MTTGVPAQTNEKLLNIFFIAVLVVHWFDLAVKSANPLSTGLFYGILIYTFVGIFGFLLLRNESGSGTRVLGLSVLAILLPLVGALISSGFSLLWSGAPDAIAFVIAIFPVWGLYLAYFRPTNFTSISGLIYFVVLFLLFLFQYSGLIYSGLDVVAPGVSFPSFSPGFTFWQLLTKGWYGFLGFFGEAKIRLNQVVNETQQSFELAAYGDVYTGRVEAQQGKRLGVDLGQLQAVQSVIRENTPITVVARLQAQTLDQPTSIKLFCSCCERDSPTYTCGPGDKEGCDIRPKAEFIVTSQDTRDIECRFTKDIMKKGQQTIGMRAEFSFTTSAFLRTYLMDASRVQALQKERINPLVEYKIKDKNPVAIFTPGPVNIGMALSEAPLPMQIDRKDTEKLFSLQISMTNQWQGKITKINSMKVFLPEGITLVDVNGYDYDEECEIGINGAECIIPESSLLLPDTRLVAVQARLGLSVPKQSYEVILGKDPIAVRFFKTSIDYIYEIERATSVMVT